MNTYRRIEAPEEVYECPRCGAAVVNIPTHESAHSITDATVSILNEFLKAEVNAK